jgi:hypothetical protein
MCQTRLTCVPARSFFFTLALLTASTIPRFTRAGITTAPATAPADDPLQPLVEQLGDPDAAKRDSAEKQLVFSGKAAIGALGVACQSPDIEVALRARRALRKIQIFRLPGVADEALGAAAGYLDGIDSDHRKPQLNKLFAMQPAPNAVLTRLIPLEPDDDLQRQILYQLGTGYRDAVPRMLIDEDDPQAVLMVLNASAQMWGHSEAADDAAALLLCGQIDQQIAMCAAEEINGDTTAREHAAMQLCYLYRVCGKYDQAMKYARMSRDPSLIFLVLQDAGDWSAAAKEPDDRWRDPIIVAAYHSAFARLSGHPQAGVEFMSAVSATAPSDIDRSFTPSRFFLLNDLPLRGMELLTEQHPAVVFQMRLARGEIREAIDIAKKYAKHPRDATDLAAQYEQLRRTLGELPEPATQPGGNAAPDFTALDRQWIEAVKDLQQKRFRSAADRFGRLWALDRTHFDRLYLQGYALQQAGDVQTGKTLMDQATLLPLGDPLRRWQLAAQLDSAGLTDAAEQQRDLGLRTGGDFDEVGFSEIFNTRAENALDRRQWHQAAEALDRLCLINLSSQLEWHDPVRLLTVPATAHLVKAREARDRRDMETMDRELAMYQQYLPASSDMVIEMVPALDSLGEHDRAEKIFESVYVKLSAITVQYPKSVAYLNELAWMCACGNRRLDEGYKAAEAAMMLRPEDFQLMDTLAELHFRRRDRAGAVEIEKRAATLTSDPYIARQVKRFQTANVPSTTQPVAAPE